MGPWLAAGTSSVLGNQKGVKHLSCSQGIHAAASLDKLVCECRNMSTEWSWDQEGVSRSVWWVGWERDSAEGGDPEKPSQRNSCLSTFWGNI